MKIVLVPEAELEAFADVNGIELVVKERRRDSIHQTPRFYAYGESVEVSEGPMLRGAYGNGETVEKALRNLADVWSERRLVVDAYAPTRREISAPRLHYKEIPQR